MMPTKNKGENEMNIEIANRLYQYRKTSGLSQEELAEAIGVSRQAVSKWERAEASPDTDNLIELSKVYGVTLDEMLYGDEDSDDAESGEEPEVEAAANDEEPEGMNVESDGDHVNISLHGIHVHDRHGTKVDIDRHGIFVNEGGEQKVYTDENGHIHKSDSVIAEEKKLRHPLLKFPYPILAVIAYLLFGYFNVMGGWAFGWIVFLTIPLYYTLVEAILRRDAKIFAYPVLAAGVFLVLGFTMNLWHPAWIIFLTIPIYYAIAGAFKRK